MVDRIRLRSVWLRQRSLPLLVLAGGLAISLLAWRQDRVEQQALLQQAFDAELRQAGQRLQRRMVAQEHLLQGLRGLLEAVPAADAQALRRYVQTQALGSTRDYAGLAGLGLAPAVRASELPALLSDWRRAAGLPALQLRPEGQRELHVPLILLEPGQSRNLVELGRDLWAEPPVRAALEAARDSGRLALSSVAGSEAAAAPNTVLWLTLPVFHGDGPADTPAQRRQRLRGWVLAPVQLPEMMASLYGELPAGLNLRLLDESVPGAGSSSSLLLYGAAEPAAAASLLLGRELLQLGGRRWTLELRADARFAQRHGADTASAVLGVGLVVTLLLSLVAWQLTTARDHALTLAERMTRALRETEQRWAIALEGAGDGAWDWQPASGLIKVSPRWLRLMSLPSGSGQISLSRMLACVHPEDRSQLQAELQRCLDGHSVSVFCEYRVACGGGGSGSSGNAWRWVLARATVAEREAGDRRPQRVVGTLSDIDERRNSEERVRFMALHDPLTALANRAHFGERTHFALANARRYNENIGLILLDLDHFKPVNDSHGHAVGDQLLQMVARRIKSSVRETDTVGRVGGDEFVVLLTGPVTRETAQVVADKIFNQVAQPLEIAGLHLEITCSLGLALYPEDGGDELSLTQAADEAMYRNKRAGRRLMGEVGTPPLPGGVTDL